MKTPRVTDFDPDAKVPSLKSSLDHMPTIEKPKPPVQEVPSVKEPEQAVPVPRPVPDTPSGTPYPVPPVKRIMRQRQPYDVYEDQHQTLKQIADMERERGLPGSMSRMVRDGIDLIIARKK